MARHRRLESAAIAADPLDEHALDLRIAPATDTRRRVRRDVARHRGPPGVAKFETAAAEPACVVLHAVRPPRLTGSRRSSSAIGFSPPGMRTNFMSAL